MGPFILPILAGLGWEAPPFPTGHIPWERPGMPGRRLLCCRPFYGEPSSLSAFEENSDTELSRQKLDRRSFAEHGNNPGS